MKAQYQQPQVLHVAVGVIRNSLGAILVARRHEHSHQGGLWEFPGGKVEPGESVLDGLRRELKEELSIEVESAKPLIKIAHDYGDKQVLLDVWRVDAFRGQAQGAENQPIRWVSPDDLAKLDFPAANKPIVAAARLPEYYPIVDGGLEDELRLFNQLERLCQLGYGLAQWRVKSLERQAYLALARRAVAYCRPRGLGLLLNADPGLVLEAGAAGVHLTGQRLQALRQRPLPAGFWVAASCHCPEDLTQAEKLNLDFAVLSPVLATPSHPDTSPLGWQQFGDWTEAARIPIFALGGVGCSDLEQARKLGAQGIAGIRGFL